MRNSFNKQLMLSLLNKAWSSQYLWFYCKQNILQRFKTKRANFARKIKLPAEARQVFPPPTRRRPSVDIAPLHHHPCELSRFCFCGLLTSILGEYPRRSFTCDSNKMALNKLSIDKVDLKDKRVLMRYSQNTYSIFTYN